MMPMVFWASLVPWDSENAAAEPSCARRNHRSTDPYGTFRKIHETGDHHREAERHADQRRKDDEGKRLDPCHSRHDGAHAHVRHGRSRVAADQGVRGGGRDPEVPRDQVPDDRPDEPAEHDVGVDDR